MSKEREFLKKLRYASLLENDLRKELEELLAKPEQEPVAWMWEEEGDEGCVETTIDINKPRVNMYRENIRPLYIAPSVKSEHIEDKLAMFAPVGYLYKQMDCYGEWATIFKVDKPYITWHDIKDIVPVYTAPPKREPVEECTNSDTWNCKYCNKTNSCKALKDSRNFAPPKREPLSTDIMLRLITEHRDFPLNLVRAVEKAHGIGGGE